MQTTAADRDELNRLADDGCPNGGEPTDLSELWLDLGGSD